MHRIVVGKQNGNIKIFCDSIPKNNSILILKISGLWETSNNFGLTYKFIYLHKVSRL